MAMVQNDSDHQTIISSWKNVDIPGLERLGMYEVLVESTIGGRVLREVGLDSMRRIVYVSPAKSGKFRFGLFDCQVIVLEERHITETSAEEFDCMWRSGEVGTKGGGSN